MNDDLFFAAEIATEKEILDYVRQTYETANLTDDEAIDHAILQLENSIQRKKGGSYYTWETKADLRAEQQLAKRLRKMQ